MNTLEHLALSEKAQVPWENQLTFLSYGFLFFQENKNIAMLVWVMGAWYDIAEY